MIQNDIEVVHAKQRELIREGGEDGLVRLAFLAGFGQSAIGQRLGILLGFRDAGFSFTIDIPLAELASIPEQAWKRYKAPRQPAWHALAHSPQQKNWRSANDKVE